MSLLLIGLAGSGRARWAVDEYLRNSGCYVPLICREQVLNAMRVASDEVAKDQSHYRWRIGVVEVTCNANADWVRRYGGRVVHLNHLLSDGSGVDVGEGDVVLTGNNLQLTHKMNSVVLDFYEEVRNG